MEPCVLVRDKSDEVPRHVGCRNETVITLEALSHLAKDSLTPVRPALGDREWRGSWPLDCSLPSF
jgi:hypothetical protein